MRYLLLLLALGCADPLAPDGAYRVAPPDSMFTAHWQRIEACSGLHGDWHRITWFAVPGRFQSDGQDLAGLWVEPHTIYIIEAALSPSAFGTAATITPHEMLHDLLQRGDHPPVFTKCGV